MRLLSSIVARVNSRCLAYRRALINRYPGIFYRPDPGTPGNRVAICYHGPPRSLRAVVDSHRRHLLEPLRKAGFDYRLFVHTWRFAGPQFIWETPIASPVDYAAYDLLPPHSLRADDQDQYLTTVDFADYFYLPIWQEHGDQAVLGEWRPGLIRNYLCSLESQKRVTAMVSGDCSLVVYLRPDLALSKDLDCALLAKLNIGQIILPDFEHHEGFNDKFSIMRTQTAKLYGSRGDWLAGFRRQHGRIVSEKFTRHFILSNRLRPLFTDIRFAVVRPQ